MSHNTAALEKGAMLKQRSTFNFVRDICWLLGSLGFGIALSGVRCSAHAAPTSGMDRLHANSNEIPGGTLTDGVLSIDLEIREAEWFPEDERGPSLKVFGLAERGKPAQVPGPLIRVRQNTTIHAQVHNLLAVNAVMHGLHARPGKEEEVLEIPSRETRSVTFQAGEPGAYYYWATAGGDTLNGRPYKEDSQLSGAFVVDPPGVVPPDRIFLIAAWRDRFRPEESLDIPVINGKSWPYTERLEYTAGSDVRWRWLNASAQVHPMHLHGSYFRVDSMGDGESDTEFPAAQRKLVATQLMPVGGTMTTYWQPKEPGRWLFHCHILTHVSPETMMLRRGQNYAPTSTAHDHAAQDMAGLVMGITILPPPGEQNRLQPSKPRRRIDLVIDKQQRARNPNGFAVSESGDPTGVVSAPGPTLVLAQGEPVAIRVINRLSEPTSIHWHGIELQSYYDGVPGWTGDEKHVTPMIQPGKSFDVYFNPPRAGTFIYHTHMRDLSQLSSGLYGPIVVLPPRETFHPETDKIFLMSRNGRRKDGEFLLNGATQLPVQQWHAGLGYRLRFININANNTVRITLTQNGTPVVWTSVAKDGADLPPEQALTGPAAFLIAPGETYDFHFRPGREGEMTLRFDLPLLKETVTQAIHLDAGGSQ
jgi:manganese oxidase